MSRVENYTKIQSSFPSISGAYLPLPVIPRKRKERENGSQCAGPFKREVCVSGKITWDITPKAKKNKAAFPHTGSLSTPPVAKEPFSVQKSRLELLTLKNHMWLYFFQCPRSKFMTLGSQKYSVISFLFNSSISEEKINKKEGSLLTLIHTIPYHQSY